MARIVLLILLSVFIGSTMASANGSISEACQKKLLGVINSLTQQGGSKSVVYFIQNSFIPLLGDRCEYSELSLDKQKEGDGFVLKIETLGFINDPELFREKGQAADNPKNLLASQYEISFSEGIMEQSALPSLEKTSTQSVIQGKNVALLKGKVELKIDSSSAEVNNWENINASLRSLFRADPYLHPYSKIDFQVAEKKGLKPSKEQQQAIKDLVVIDSQQATSGEVRKSLLMAPVGTGKTYIYSQFIKELRNTGALSKNNVLVVVYQNNVALRQIGRFFQKEFGIPSSQVLSMFDGNKRVIIPQKPNFKLVLATRSSYFKFREDLHQLIEFNPQVSWTYMLDEMHHIGKVDGQFDQILSGSNGIPGLDEVLTNKDRVTYVSATPWHYEKDLLNNHIGSRIVAPFLTEKELDTLTEMSEEGTSGDVLFNLVQTQMFRAIRAGYLSPVSKFVLSDYVGEQPFAEILNDTKSVPQGESIDTYVTIYKQVIDHIADQIMSNRVEGVFDHGIIFVPSIDHANVYTALLNKKFQSAGAGGKFLPFHSKLSSEERAVSEDFFLSASGKSHKYWVVVEGVKEAVDIPLLNLMVNARNIIDFRALMQMFGRGTRTFNGKTGIRLLDLTGSFLKLLNNNVEEQIVVNGITLPQLRNEYVRQGLTIDLSSVNEEQLVTQDVTSGMIVQEESVVGNSIQEVLEPEKEISLSELHDFLNFTRANLYTGKVVWISVQSSFKLNPQLRSEGVLQLAGVLSEEAEEYILDQLEKEEYETATEDFISSQSRAKRASFFRIEQNDYHLPSLVLLPHTEKSSLTVAREIMRGDGALDDLFEYYDKKKYLGSTERVFKKNFKHFFLSMEQHVVNAWKKSDNETFESDNVVSYVTNFLENYYSLFKVLRENPQFEDYEIVAAITDHSKKKRASVYDKGTFKTLEVRLNRMRRLDRLVARTYDFQVVEEADLFKMFETLLRVSSELDDVSDFDDMIYDLYDWLEENKSQALKEWFKSLAPSKQEAFRLNIETFVIRTNSVAMLKYYLSLPNAKIEFAMNIVMNEPVLLVHGKQVLSDYFKRNGKKPVVRRTVERNWEKITSSRLEADSALVTESDKVKSPVERKMVLDKRGRVEREKIIAAYSSLVHVFLNIIVDAHKNTGSTVVDRYVETLIRNNTDQLVVKEPKKVSSSNWEEHQRELKEDFALQSSLEVPFAQDYAQASNTMYGTTDLKIDLSFLFKQLEANLKKDYNIISVEGLVFSNIMKIIETQRRSTWYMIAKFLAARKRAGYPVPDIIVKVLDVRILFGKTPSGTFVPLVEDIFAGREIDITDVRDPRNKAYRSHRSKINNYIEDTREAFEDVLKTKNKCVDELTEKSPVKSYYWDRQS